MATADRVPRCTGRTLLAQIAPIGRFPRMETVLIVEADGHRRELFVAVCQARGIQARGVRSTADIERWPIDGVVVTDLAHLSPWWTLVGTTHVLAVVATAADGEAALANGATAWIQYDADGRALAAFLDDHKIGATCRCRWDAAAGNGQLPQ
jgi:hypothetical protein